MATNETENRERNAYFAELDAIAAKLDEAAKILTPDESDDGTPPDGGEKAESNSYFASFRNIASSLARLNEALAERIAAGGGEVPTAYGFCNPEISEFERITLQNRAINCVALDGCSPHIILPPAIDGKARDFILRVEQGGGAKLLLPVDMAYESCGDGVLDEIDSGTTALFFFFETKPGVFLVSRKDVAAITQ